MTRAHTHTHRNVEKNKLEWKTRRQDSESNATLYLIAQSFFLLPNDCDPLTPTPQSFAKDSKQQRCRISDSFSISMGLLSHVQICVPALTACFHPLIIPRFLLRRLSRSETFSKGRCTHCVCVPVQRHHIATHH